MGPKCQALKMDKEGVVRQCRQKEGHSGPHKWWSYDDTLMWY